MKNLTTEQAQKITDALAKLSAATQELDNIVDEIGYELSSCRPTYMEDFSDFTYDIISWVDDEQKEVALKTQE